jgi:hypothetical protein
MDENGSRMQCRFDAKGREINPDGGFCCETYTVEETWTDDSL